MCDGCVRLIEVVLLGSPAQRIPPMPVEHREAWAQQHIPRSYSLLGLSTLARGQASLSVRRRKRLRI